MFKDKNKRKQKRIKRVKAKIFGSAQRPRLSVFRSNRQIYAQIINDETGETLVSASEKEISQTNNTKPTKSDKAKEIGMLIAKKAAGKKINKVVFDRHGYQFHGRVKHLADGARENGLIF